MLEVINLIRMQNLMNPLLEPLIRRVVSIVKMFALHISVIYIVLTISCILVFHSIYWKAYITWSVDFFSV